LELKHDKLLSKLALKCKVRHYSTVGRQAAAVKAAADGGSGSGMQGVDLMGGGRAA